MCGPPCSTDLKKVLDCLGNVIEECGPDMACLNGSCSNDPCAAADAAKSSLGCEFWPVKTEPVSSGGCFAAIVANGWDAPAHIEVSRLGMTFADTSFIAIPQGAGESIAYAPYDPVVGVPPGEVAIVSLAYIPPFVGSCPVPAASDQDVAVHGTARGHAFSIKTDRPVAAYTMLPYGAGDMGMTSASLLLPASAWGTNYLAINPYETFSALTLSLAILAREDGTVVTIVPKAMIGQGDGVDYALANTPTNYALSAGEYVQFSQHLELTGSAIQSNKPIAMWGATSCFWLPNDTYGACDNAHQQIPPVSALGSRYAAVRHRNRKAATSEEATPWRLVGAVDGTALSWTPSIPTGGAPTTLNQGEIALFFAPGPFVVESQDKDHPFYLAQYMTSASYVNPDPVHGDGDPEWVNVVPTEQYLDRYLFFTDPTYSDASLVVVRKRAPVTGQFADVTLDCAGSLSGWQPLGDFQYTRVDLAVGLAGVNGCDNGRHEIVSEAPFGVTVWGWGDGFSILQSTQGASGWVSYAYSAGASLRPINDVVVPTTPR
jgi:hypothetical protein